METLFILLLGLVLHGLIFYELFLAPSVLKDLPEPSDKIPED